MLTLNSPEITQATTLRWRSEGKTAFVPTMGCLHEGHLRLVQLAKSLADRTIVSIFVNPMQFAPTDDLNRYPRPFEADSELLKNEGVDLLFAPSAGDLYPDGFETRVQVGPLANRLCGEFRPGHFQGVATVCLKLFEITRADVAVFGEKDFQQLAVIRQMVSDFNLPISILSHPIVRETDGLAVSSRNRYLTPGERQIAPRLFESLLAAADCAQTATVGEIVKSALGTLGPEFLIDYVSVASESDLMPQSPDTVMGSISRARLFIAARLGQTRLIDNMRLVNKMARDCS